MIPGHEWRATHPYTVRLLAVVGLTAFAGLGDWVTGYGRPVAVAAAFYMFSGLMLGMGLAERRPKR